MTKDEALKRHRGKVLEILARYKTSNPMIARDFLVNDDELTILIDGNDSLSLSDLADMSLEIEELLPLTVYVKTPGFYKPEMYSRILATAVPLGQSSHE
jgi:hypothetical protein